MKVSQFNFIMHRDSKAYWFNALSFKHFIISEQLSEKIESLINEEDNLCSLPTVLRNKLFENGFLIEDTCDELEIIRERNDKAIHSKDYMLVIMPTLNCNFKCWYCIQDHVPSMMTDSTIERVKNHIRRMVNEEKISSLSLEWFGGEPFMFFDMVVKPLTAFAKEECERANIPFEASATTNGFFISENVAQMLKPLRFTHFQITIDGNKEFHDKVKFQNGCSSAFEKTLDNINGILSHLPDAVVHLRLNYTHDNLFPSIVDEINPHISEDNRGRIVILTRKVWQASVDKSYHSTLKEILDRFSQYGYITTRWSPIANYIPCYANREFYNAINYNGHVVKCTACNDIYDENPKGVLQEDGSILWNDDFDKKYQCKSFENDECLSCKELPICMGNCPKDFVDGRKDCKKKYLDETIENCLIDYIENYEQQQS